MSRLIYTVDMADENSTKQPMASGIVEHLCEHPGRTAWGGFGFSSGARAQWWCDRHYPYWGDATKAKYAALPV